MLVTYENIFPGAKITDSDGKELYVYKANAKSFYGGNYTFQEFTEMFEARLKSITFVSFCKSKNIKQLKYGVYNIDEKEAAKKESLTKNIENAKKSNILTKSIKTSLDSLINEYLKEKKSLRCVGVQVGSKQVRILAQNGHAFLVSIDGDYILYDVDNSEVSKLGNNSSVDFNESSIPWVNLSSFNKECNK